MLATLVQEKKHTYICDDHKQILQVSQVAYEACLNSGLHPGTGGKKTVVRPVRGVLFYYIALLPPNRGFMYPRRLTCEMTKIVTRLQSCYAARRADAPHAKYS